MIEEWMKLKEWLNEKLEFSSKNNVDYRSYLAFYSVRRKIKELEDDYDYKSLAEAGYF